MFEQCPVKYRKYQEVIIISFLLSFLFFFLSLIIHIGNLPNPKVQRTNHNLQEGEEERRNKERRGTKARDRRQDQKRRGQRERDKEERRREREKRSGDGGGGRKGTIGVANLACLTEGQEACSCLCP